MGNLAAIHRKNPDPAPTASDLISHLGYLMRDKGGSIEVAGFAIYYDENWEEEGPEENTLQACPSYIVERIVNGKRVQTPHGSLADALREVGP